MFIISQALTEIVNLDNVSHISLEPHYYENLYDLVAHMTNNRAVKLGIYDKYEAKCLMDYIIDEIKKDTRIIQL